MPDRPCPPALAVRGHPHWGATAVAWAAYGDVVGTAGNQSRERTVFSCVRRVGDGVIRYELVLPAARLLEAAPLLDHEFEGVFREPFPAAGLRVAVSRPLTFDPIDELRGFGIVTLPLGTRLGFTCAPEIRHGMVRVTIVAPLPETVWRLPAPLTPGAAQLPASSSTHSP